MPLKLKYRLPVSKLKDLVPLHSLGAANLNRLTNHAHLYKYEAGEQIFELGDKSPSTLYLMDGEVDLIPQDGPSQHVIAGSKNAIYPLANLKPRRFSGTALTNVTIADIDSNVLDKLMSWSQVAANTKGLQLGELGKTHKDTLWISRLLKTPAFMMLSADSIEQLIEAFEPVSAGDGEIIIRQGEPGDFYYLIREGKCRVERTDETGKQIVLAELGAGKAFGEEALLSSNPRNATVRMAGDGILMRLSRPDFDRLLESQLVRSVSPENAAKAVESGAKLIDCRTEKEFYRDGQLHGSINIPLYLLRLKLSSLDRQFRYVVFCDTGERSSAAVYLMRQKGFRAYSVKRGLGALLSCLPGDVDTPTVQIPDYGD